MQEDTVRHQLLVIAHTLDWGNSQRLLQEAAPPAADISADRYHFNCKEREKDDFSHHSPCCKCPSHRLHENQGGKSSMPCMMMISALILGRRVPYDIAISGHTLYVVSVNRTIHRLQELSPALHALSQSPPLVRLSSPQAMPPAPPLNGQMTPLLQH
jgi:hypothetical protein